MGAPAREVFSFPRLPSQFSPTFSNFAPSLSLEILLARKQVFEQKREENKIRERDRGNMWSVEGRKDEE